MVGICECGNEPSGSTQCEEFLDLDEKRLSSQEGSYCME